MKNLWTPWRMEHVLGKKETTLECIFEPPGSTNFDKKNLLLYRNEYVVVLLNRFPYANGHLLVSPIKHVSELTHLNQKELSALIQMITKCSDILTKCLKPNGMNIGLNLGEIAGAGITDHLHFHIVPRWEGDHNFMTVCADIRTIPQHIDNTFDLLLPFFSTATNNNEHE